MKSLVGKSKDKVMIKAAPTNNWKVNKVKN